MKKKILSSFCILIFMVTTVMIYYTKVLAIESDTNNIDINQFYYEQLTSDLAKDIYDGILNDTSGTGKFTVYTDLSFGLEDVTQDTEEDMIQELYEKNISPEVHDAFCAFILDHPEYYWVRYNGIDGTITPEILYNMSDETINITQLDMELYVLPQVENREEFETKLTEVADSITGENNYEILKNIYDYIITNVSNESLTGDEIQQTAYGALINNKASDEGASNLFTLLCREKGIDSVIIRGELSDGETTKLHQWSGVYLEDKWYAVDTDLDNAEDTNNWFMVGNNTQIGDKKFSEILEANIKPYEEQKTTFQEPILTNNQYEEFSVTVEYSTTETTKQGVVVTISANKEMVPIDGWTLSEDKKYMQREFYENVEGVMTLTSVYGEKINQEVSINNIENDPPDIEVTYSNTEEGASEVTVTITSDRELQELEGWELSEDKKTLTKTYTENTTETVIVTDTLSNIAGVEISISNIIGEAPECKVSYSTIEQTNGSVVVTITSNREMEELEGWELSEDKKTLTKTYNENTDEEIELEDIYGNKIKANITIKNIDKESPKLEVSYSTTNPTNDKVKVYIKSDEQLNKLDGWEISADGYTISKYYFENETNTIKVQDLAGNETETEIRIENIDKEEPQYTVEYENTDNGIIVHITANEEIQPIEGWELSSDRKAITKTYTENKKEVIEIKDLAGNISEVPVTITSIDSQNNNQNSQDGSNIATQSGIEGLYSTLKRLPNAGKTTFTILITALIVVSIVFYLKYKQYSRYSKYMKK